MKRILSALIFFMTSCLTPLWVISSPIPTTGSTLINKPQWSSVVLSQLGFNLKFNSNEWIYIENPLSNSYPRSELNLTKPQIELGFQNLSETARLSLKADKIYSKGSLEQYLKKYLRDYNQYGFELLSTQTLKMNSQPVVVIDLLQKNKLTQSRQVFFQHNDNLVIATCTDKTELFKKTFDMCQAVLNTFTWQKL